MATTGIIRPILGILEPESFNALSDVEGLRLEAAAKAFAANNAPNEAHWRSLPARMQQLVMMLDDMSQSDSVSYTDKGGDCSRQQQRRKKEDYGGYGEARDGRFLHG